MTTKTPEAVEFPVPEFTGLDAAFGADANRYLTREQIGDEHYSMRSPMAEVAGSLFFKGGKLADHGLRFKEGIDPEKAITAVRAWLSSFAPKHEIKIGTVGYALEQWCEPDPGADR